MDISKWPLDKIMQLPDNAFGQRYLVSCALATSGDNPVWDISEVSFPDKAVLWSVTIMWVYSNVTTAYVRLGMANKIPKNRLEMDTATNLVTGLGKQGFTPRRIPGYQYGGHEVYNMRKHIQPQGKKLVAEANAWTDKDIVVRVSALVSSIPKEIPEWMISGLASVRS